MSKQSIFGQNTLHFMATWRYEAKNSAGAGVSGTLVASDRRTALEILRGQGLFLTLLEAAPLRKEQKQVPIQQSPEANNAPRSDAIRAPTDSAPPPPVAPAKPPVTPLQRPPVNMGKPTTGAGVPGDPQTQNSPSLNAAPRSQSALPPLSRQPYLHASKRDLSNFFRQLGSAAHAGVSTGKALSTLEQHATQSALRSVAGQLKERVTNGEPLSVGMQSFPGLFTPLMIGIVSAGERGGFLERSFSRLAEYSERDYELETSIKRETWYPKLIILCAILIPGVVPLVLSGFSAFLYQVIPPLLFLGSVWLALKIIRIVAPAMTMLAPLFHLWDGLKFALPIVGKVTRGLATAKFCRALGALYSAGISPSQGVRLGAQACGNQVMHDRCLTIIPRLEHGESLTESLGSLKIFHPMALQMLQVGEESGDIDSQLEKAADFLEGDAETAIRQAIPVLGILVFLAVAAYVGSLVLAGVQSYGAQVDGLIEK